MTDEAKQELKFCDCGWAGVLVKDKDNWYHVHCCQISCPASTALYAVQSAATFAWNRRAQYATAKSDTSHPAAEDTKARDEAVAEDGDDADKLHAEWISRSADIARLQRNGHLLLERLNKLEQNIFEPNSEALAKYGARMVDVFQGALSDMKERIGALEDVVTNIPPVDAPDALTSIRDALGVLRERLEKLESIDCESQHRNGDASYRVLKGRIEAIETQNVSKEDMMRFAGQFDNYKQAFLGNEVRILNLAGRIDKFEKLERQVATACLVTGATESRMSTLERKFAENFYDRFGEMPVEPEPQKEPVAESRKLEAWVNFYKYSDGSAFLKVYSTNEDADANAVGGRIACVRVVAVEGEGLE